MEVSSANGHAALAKLTAAGFKALVMRLKLSQPGRKFNPAKAQASGESW